MSRKKRHRAPWLGRSRTALAALLVGVAVALPIVTWLVAGGRLLAREAALERAGVNSHAYKKGLKLAGRIASRLHDVQTAEEDRSFSEYQNIRHDPGGAVSGVAVTLSPLARGPQRPEIAMHFQVDEDGRLTLPTVNDQIPELGMERSADCQALRALEDVAIYISGGVGRDAGCPLAATQRPPFAASDGPMAIQHVEVLDSEAWRQHVEANALYRDIKISKRSRSALRRFTAAAEDGESVYVLDGPFAWYTLPVSGQPELVSLRNVETPAGTWVQGFVVARAAIDRSLENDDFPARFVPVTDGSPGFPARVSVPAGVRSNDPTGETVMVSVEGTPWAVAIDAAPARAALDQRAARERKAFLRIVLLCALAAGLAGSLVVALVGQTERLANQRAQFAASAAHELRTPLAGLRLYGEMLAEGLGDPARARQYAHRLASEAERLGRVVSNVLSFTRLERSMLSVDARKGDLAARVREILDRMRPTLESAGVQLETAIASVPAVIFDHDAIGHIVQNLVDNAEKYTRGARDRRIQVAVCHEPGSVQLSVADHGPGVTRSLRRRLFRPFSRGEDTGAAEGLGLGLVLVRALAEAQGASVRYRDAPGGGALFIVRFPSAQADVA